MTMTLKSAVRTVLLIAAVTSAGTAMAAEEAAREASGTLAEVLVTAQKREESLQQVPIAVTALDAAALEKTYSRDIQSVAQLAPNLIVDPILGNGTAAISIRGMQLNDVEKSFDPAVSVYLDGVYLATTTGALLQMFDADAVEVLRGPQGTLFGRNTIGGLLHIRRAKPTGELGGKFEVRLGRFDQRDVQGVVNFPSLADGKLKTKLSVISQSGGGYFTNISAARNGRREGDNDFFGATASVLYAPTDNLEFWLTLDYFDDATPTRPVTALTGPQELFCQLFAAVGGCGAPAGDSNYHRKTRTTAEQKAFVKTKAVTLNSTWTIAEGQRIASVTGFRTQKDDAYQEFDGVEPDLFHTQRPQSADQFSEELRLESDWTSSLRSTVGVYYFDGTYKLDQSTYFFGPLAARPYFTQDTKSTAVFGQVDWSVTDQLTLSLGGRYNNEKKNACGINQDPANVAGAAQSSFGDCSIASRSADNLQNTYVDPVTGQTVTATGRKTWSKFTPRVSATWKFDESKMVYGTYSEGFRSGGFNGRASAAVTLGPYNPEKVKSFELGAKTQFLENRLRVNAALFTTKYSDKQEDVVFPDPQLVTVTLVQNASSVKLNGAEFEVVAVPVRGLTAGLNLGILDSKIDKWLAPGISGGTVDKSNFELRRAPKFTVGANLQYEQPIGGDNFLVYNLNYAYKDDYYIVGSTVSPYNTTPSGGFNDNPGHVKAYGDLDASITYDTGPWQLTLWGKNLTNESHMLHVLDVGTNYAAGPGGQPIPVAGLWTFGTINPPRTYGVDFKYKF